MAVDLKIHLVQGSVVAFSIDYEFYYLRIQPVPQLFDADLAPQIVHNFDSWFQAKTHQRYSYRGFLDMVGAFADALRLTYSAIDINHFCVLAAHAAKQYVLTRRSSDYKKRYWVEMLDPAKLETVHAELVRDKYDALRAKLGDDAFYNYLCRLWSLARTYRPTVAGVFERLIRRLGKLPEEPRWPRTDDLDADLVRAVLGQVCKDLGVYKDVPADVRQKVEALSNVEHPSSF